MATVRRDNEGHCIIELGRNTKKVRCIVRLETVYDVREFRLEEKELVGKGVDKVTVTHLFDKEYTPVTNPDGSDYPVKKCAMKYMSNQYTPCTDRARRELMILVLNSELNLVAKFAADQMSTALETGPEGGYVLCTPEELAEEHTEKDLITIFNNLCKPEEQIVGRFKAGKAKLAEFIYELAKQTDLKPVALPQTREKKQSGQIVAKKEKVISMYKALKNEKHHGSSLRTKVYLELEKHPEGATAETISAALIAAGGEAPLDKVKGCLNILAKDGKAEKIVPSPAEAE